MKRIVEINDGGFEAAMGEKVLLMCGTYFYTGVLSGVNEDHVELTEAKVVYETGEWSSGSWKDAQTLPAGQPWRVMKHAIESWGPSK